MGGGGGGREGRGRRRRERSVMGSVTILQWPSLEHNDYWKKGRKRKCRENSFKGV